MSVRCDERVTAVDSATWALQDLELSGADGTSFLSTKFNIPQPRIDLISRPQLLKQLYASVSRGHKLTLVCAPAGFGKTTLLSEWVNHTQAPLEYPFDSSMKVGEHSPLANFAWVSLDEGDDNVVRFWTAIITAVQINDANIGRAALAALKSPHPLKIESVLTALINDITEAVLNATEHTKVLPSVLIIDDYHLIQLDEIHKGIAFFISHLPHPVTGMHIVISTRVEPPISLSRLRARAQVTEIRASDLRFTYEETTVFLNHVMDFQLSPENLVALEARTEGWIAGLQLAAVTMEAMRSAKSDFNAKEGFTEFIAAFTGSSRYVLDYLGEEILQRQPDDIQRFLLTTSILDKMTGSLCDTVLGTLGSHATLQALEQSNLFIVSLDQNRVWYRYHRLFVEFLRTRLHQSRLSSLHFNDEVPMTTLYLRASIWYENRDMVNEAIQYAFAAENYIQSARLIENAARGAMIQGEAGALLEWIEALPAHLIQTRPRLYLARLWALVSTGQIDTAQSYLESFIHPPFAGEATLAGEIAAIRGFVQLLQGNVTAAIEYAQDALKLLPEDDFFLRGLVALNLGRAYDIRGDMASACQVYEEARRLGQTLDNFMVSLMAISQLGDVKMLQGRLSEAADIYHQAVQLAEQPGGQQPLAGLAYAGLGIVHYQWNELETAERYLQEGVRLGQQWENTDVLIYSMVHLSWVKWAQANTPAVQELFKDITKALDGQIASQPTISFARTHLARMELLLGNTSAASLWIDAYLAEVESTPSDLAYTKLVTWARICLSDEQPAQVIKRLLPVIDKVRVKGLVQYEIELLVLLSIAHYAMGHTNPAVEYLESALVLGSTARYTRVFIDNGAPIYAILRQVRTRGHHTEYTGILLEAAQKPKLALKTTVSHSSTAMLEQAHTPILLDALSGREHEVLHLLAVGLSNKEIAQALYIAVGTVKQHLKNIYSKFDVHNRTEAVYNAQFLGVL